VASLTGSLREGLEGLELLSEGSAVAPQNTTCVLPPGLRRVALLEQWRPLQQTLAALPEVCRKAVVLLRLSLCVAEIVLVLLRLSLCVAEIVCYCVSLRSHCVFSFCSGAGGTASTESRSVALGCFAPQPPAFGGPGISQRVRVFVSFVSLFVYLFIVSVLGWWRAL
jgi:hypothetical protein